MPEGTARVAVVETRDGRPTVDRVAQYLPDNFWARDHPDGRILITGYDKAGWTLDGYVIPRLASGLIFAREVGQ